MQKPCKVCGETKPLDDFYKHPQGLLGRLHRCKECHKAAVRKNRADNIERYRAYDRDRSDRPERVMLREKVRQQRAADPNIRTADARKRAEWRIRNAEKARATLKVRRAIANGKLKVRPCERCGFALGIQAHHEDYSKPLDVVWLCTPCHGARHREINEDRRQGRAA